MHLKVLMQAVLMGKEFCNYSDFGGKNYNVNFDGFLIYKFNKGMLIIHIYIAYRPAYEFVNQIN